MISTITCQGNCNYIRPLKRDWQQIMESMNYPLSRRKRRLHAASRLKDPFMQKPLPVPRLLFMSTGGARFASLEHVAKQHKRSAVEPILLPCHGICFVNASPKIRVPSPCRWRARSKHEIWPLSDRQIAIAFSITSPSDIPLIHTTYCLFNKYFYKFVRSFGIFISFGFTWFDTIAFDN